MYCLLIGQFRHNLSIKLHAFCKPPVQWTRCLISSYMHSCSDWIIQTWFPNNHRPLASHLHPLHNQLNGQPTFLKASFRCHLQMGPSSIQTQTLSQCKTSHLCKLFISWYTILSIGESRYDISANKKLHSYLLYILVQKFLKLTMSNVVLDWQNIPTNTSENAFKIFWVFFVQKSVLQWKK